MKQRLDALRAHLEFHTFIPLFSNAIKLVWAIPLCQEGERGVSQEL